MNQELLLGRLEKATRNLATRLAEERPDFLEFLEERQQAIAALHGFDVRHWPADARARMEEDLRWGEQIRAAVVTRQASLRQQLLEVNSQLGRVRHLGRAYSI